MVGEERGERPEDVEVHLLEWRDDFGDARNQLADKISAIFLYKPGCTNRFMFMYTIPYAIIYCLRHLQQVSIKLPPVVRGSVLLSTAM